MLLFGTTSNILFECLFCLSCSLINGAISRTTGGDDKVFQKLAGCVVVFVVSVEVAKSLGLDYTPVQVDASLPGLFFQEFLAVIVIIFITGPIKLFLDVKRG